MNGDIFSHYKVTDLAWNILFCAVWYNIVIIYIETILPSMNSCSSSTTLQYVQQEKLTLPALIILQQIQYSILCTYVIQ